MCKIYLLGFDRIRETGLLETVICRLKADIQALLHFQVFVPGWSNNAFNNRVECIFGIKRDDHGYRGGCTFLPGIYRAYHDYL